jgi:hypothetical protein
MPLKADRQDSTGLAAGRRFQRIGRQRLAMEGPLQ